MVEIKLNYKMIRYSITYMKQLVDKLFDLFVAYTIVILLCPMPKMVHRVLEWLKVGLRNMQTAP